MDRELFRRLVRWLGVVLLVHLIATLIFGVLLSNEMATAAANERFDISRNIVFWFSAAGTVFFNITYSGIYASVNGGHRRELISLSREENFSFNKYFQKQLKEFGLMIGIYAVFSLPFTLFYAIFNFDYIYTTLFEQFFILNAGMYLLSGSALLGLLLDTLLFALSFIGSRYIIYLGWVRSKLKFG